MSIANRKQVGNTEGLQDTTVSEMTPELQATIAEFRKYLDLPDPGPLLVALATVAANRIDGDAIWVLEVGPPSSGKSEILGSLTALSDVHPVGQVTEAGLLSGASTKDVEPGASGGLLMKIGIGGRGVICFKDFGSTLSLNREGRRSVLAAFREIVDGDWTRVLGTDGGRIYRWHGKAGAIGAVTEEIERHSSVMATMGERFLLYRMPRLDDDERETRIEKAMEHGPNVEQMRNDLRSAVYTLFKDGLQETESAYPEQNRIPIDLAMVVTSWRSSVIRDGSKRNIEVVPQTENPARIAKNFQQLQRGFRAIGLSEDEAGKRLVGVGLDCIPLVRGNILRMLIEGPQSTSDISERLVGYSRTTVDRHLAEVRAHRGVEVKTLERDQQPRWILPNRIAERLARLGIGRDSDLADSSGRSTNSTGAGIPDHSRSEKSETASYSRFDGGSSGTGKTEGPIPEKSEDRERESEKSQPPVNRIRD